MSFRFPVGNGTTLKFIHFVTYMDLWDAWMRGWDRKIRYPMKVFINLIKIVSFCLRSVIYTVGISLLRLFVDARWGKRGNGVSLICKSSDWLKLDKKKKNFFNPFFWLLCEIVQMKRRPNRVPPRKSWKFSQKNSMLNPFFGKKTFLISFLIINLSISDFNLEIKYIIISINSTFLYT